MIRTRKGCPQIGAGRWRTIGTREPGVLAIAYTDERATVVTVHNLDDRPHEVVLDLRREAVKELHSLLDGDDLASPTARHRIQLAPHGHRWYRGA